MFLTDNLGSLLVQMVRMIQADSLGGLLIQIVLMIQADSRGGLLMQIVLMYLLGKLKRQFQRNMCNHKLRKSLRVFVELL